MPSINYVNELGFLGYKRTLRLFRRAADDFRRLFEVLTGRHGDTILRRDDRHQWSIFTNGKTPGEQTFDAVRGSVSIESLPMDHQGKFKMEGQFSPFAGWFSILCCIAIWMNLRSNQQHSF